MNSSYLASGEELFNAKNRNQVLPSWGTKESEVCGSWLEEKQVEARLQDRQELISEIRLTRKDQLALGRWIEESKMIQLTQQAGTFWEYMGVETDIGRCLYPEEAIYLIEMGELEVIQGDMPLSIQSAQTVMLLDHYHLDQYHVYAHLARSGCKVVRHQPHLRFTKYEKQIRLDQHQAKKKKRKLKLKEDANKLKEETESIVTNEVEKEIEIIYERPNLDDAIKNFYNFLGDDVTCATKTDEIQPTITEIVETPKFSPEERQENEVTELIVKEFSSYEMKKREYMDMFPSLLGTEYQIIHAEEAELFPENSRPQKEVYKVSLQVLNYYSKYLDDGQQSNESNVGHTNWRNRGRGNYRGRQRNGGNRFQDFNNRQGRSNKRNISECTYFEHRPGASSTKIYQETYQNDMVQRGSFGSRHGKGIHSPYDEVIQDYISDIRNAGYNESGSKREIEERHEYRVEPVAERRMEHENWREFRNYNISKQEDCHTQGRVHDVHDNWVGDRSRRPYDSRQKEDGRCFEFQQNVERGMDVDNWEEGTISRQDIKNSERNYDVRRESNEALCIRSGSKATNDNLQPMRRENEMNWRDEIEYGKKMSRLDTGDTWRRDEKLPGDRWSDYRGIANKQWDYEESEAKWQRSDINTQRINSCHEMQMENQMQRSDDRLPEDRWGYDRRPTECRQSDYKDTESNWRRNDFGSERMDRYSEKPIDCYRDRNMRMNEERSNDDTLFNRGRGNHSARYEGMIGCSDDRGNRNNGGSTFRNKGIYIPDRSNDWQGDMRGDRFGHTDKWHSSGNSKQPPDWLQHDDRCSFPNTQDESTRSSQKHEEPFVDLSVVPHWKTKRRKKKWKDRYTSYPSYLIKLKLEVNSWKEYKDIVNNMSEDTLLAQGLGQALWRGLSKPLIKPAMASTLQNVLDKCSLPNHKDDTKPNKASCMKESPLTLHFDIYPPNMSFKKSSPSIPGKRITVIRDGAMPSLAQIQEVTKRFPDEAPVVCAVVTLGEVRLYTLAPFVLSSPKLT